MAIACVSAEMEKLTQNTQKQQETQHNNSAASWFSPDVGSPTEALRFSALHRYLPSNNEDADAAVVFYSSDEFRMYEFKVRRCTRGRSHDWTECPFMHPGEKARRRDPRRFSYSGNPCPDFRKGCCRRGDACEFAHGVFECWLHPDRYRTQPCKDGRNCTRRVCFFAHCLQQLRNIPAAANPSTSPPSNAALQISSQRNILNGGASFTTENTLSKNSSIGYLNKSLLSSPESTLIGHNGLSPPQSPHQESSASVFSTYALCNNYSLALPTLSCQAPRKSTDFSNSVSRPSDSAEFEMLQLLQAIRTLEVAYSSPVSPVWPEASLQQQSFHASSFQQQNLRSSPESFQNGLYSTASDLDDNFFEEEVVQQRVESGNDLQAKFYSRIASFQDHCSRYDAIDYSSPDLGWVNELVK